MKKILYLLLILTFPLLLFSQSVEVDGKLKVSVMDTINEENHLVVKRPDGTLATRMVASLLSPDTTRTLQSDLLLTSALCNCTNLPPAMIQSLLDNGYSTQNLLDFQISVQELLDAGQTPIVLFNDGVVLDSLYGKTYEGGLIFYLDTDTGNGLVAAPTDQSTSAEWGCSGTSIIGAAGTAIGTGNQNTIDIDLGCSTAGIAADICINLSLNGFDDWFLPSKDELNEMYIKIGQGASAPNNNIGGFAASFYWSSTEYDFIHAWFQSFNNGNQNLDLRDNPERVRAIRAF